MAIENENKSKKRSNWIKIKGLQSKPKQKNSKWFLL